MDEAVTIYSPSNIAVDDEERELIERDHARSGRSDLSLQTYADHFYFSSKSEIGCHDTMMKKKKKKGHARSMSTVPSDIGCHDTKKKKKKGYMKRAMSPVAISSELDGTGLVLPGQKRMPELVPISSFAGAKRMPGLVPISSFAGAKRMPGLVPISSFAGAKRMPGLVPIGQKVSKLVPMGRRMPGLVPIGEVFAKMPALQRIQPKKYKSISAQAFGNPYDQIEELDSMSLVDKTKLVHSLRSLRSALRAPFAHDTAKLSSKIEDFAAECVFANDRVEDSASATHVFTFFDKKQLDKIGAQNEFKTKRAKFVVAASVLTDLVTNTNNLPAVKEQVLNLRFGKK